MEAATDLFTVAVLSDSNLPTGGFVASAGLESAEAHGLLLDRPHDVLPAGNGEAATPLLRGPQAARARALQAFIKDSLMSYRRLVAPCIESMVDLMTSLTWQSEEQALDTAVQRFSQADACFHSQLLNHVNRRASIAQGAALLTLYSKSFSGTGVEELGTAWQPAQGALRRKRQVEMTRARRAVFLNRVKTLVRAGRAYGHLPITWGLFGSALHLDKKRCVELHLFLQARAMLSSAVRLNILGPYLAHQLLLFDVDALLRHLNSTTGLPAEDDARPYSSKTDAGMDDWDWPDDEPPYVTSTWPALEILQARHDQLHSRLFNS